MESFREMGILPEALRNYLALLGWSPADGKTEILSPEELTKQFSLDHITKSPAVFDNDKLNWLNRHYMKECPPRRLAELAVPVLQGAGRIGAEPGPDVLAWIEHVLGAVLKNISLLSELPGATRIVFEYDAKSALSTPEFQGLLADAAAIEVLKAFIPQAMAENPLTYPRFREITKAVQKETGKKGKDLFHPVRMAVTGSKLGSGTGKADSRLRRRVKITVSPACQKRGRAAEGICRGGETVVNDCKGKSGQNVGIGLSALRMGTKGLQSRVRV